MTQLPIPPDLPPHARTLLPWVRRTVASTARTLALDPTDAWDEAITALLRATVYFRPGAGTFATYARPAVSRGLWRYVARSALHHRRLTATIVHDPTTSPLATSPSAEDEALARETASLHLPNRPSPSRRARSA
jgi:hypothetical protein